jgi:hypothetical protein
MLDASQDLQSPDVIAAEIVDNLEAALEQFGEIYEELVTLTPLLQSIRYLRTVDFVYFCAGACAGSLATQRVWPFLYCACCIVRCQSG